MAVDDAGFKEGSSKERHDKKKGFEHVEDGKGPPPKEVQDLPGVCIAEMGGDVDGDKGAEGAGKGKCAKTGFNHRGCIAGESLGWTSCRRCIEGENEEDG